MVIIISGAVIKIVVWQEKTQKKKTKVNTSSYIYLKVLWFSSLSQAWKYFNLTGSFIFENISITDIFSSILGLSTCPSSHTTTGCSSNIVFFSEDFKIFRTLFSLGISVCTHTRQVENQRWSRTERVKKNHKMLRKNTIFNEHPVPAAWFRINMELLGSEISALKIWILTVGSVQTRWTNLLIYATNIYNKSLFDIFLRQTTRFI